MGHIGIAEGRRTSKIAKMADEQKKTAAAPSADQAG